MISLLYEGSKYFTQKTFHLLKFSAKDFANISIWWVKDFWEFIRNLFCIFSISVNNHWWFNVKPCMFQHLVYFFRKIIKINSIFHLLMVTVQFTVQIFNNKKSRETKAGIYKSVITKLRVRKTGILTSNSSRQYRPVGIFQN